MKIANLDCVILSGGKSSRMNREKVFMEYMGKSFLSITVHLGLQYSDKVYILGKKDELFYQNLEVDLIEFLKSSRVEYIPDKIPYAGPLYALYSYVMSSPSEKFLVLSADMPLLNKGMINVLLEQMERKNCSWIYYEDIDRSYYFPSIIKRNVLSKKDPKNIENKGFYYMKKMYTNEQFCTLSAKEKDKKYLMNINTIDEYHELMDIKNRRV